MTASGLAAIFGAGAYAMLGLGPTELIIILVIVILLFGVGRISRLAGEMGSGMRAFHEGLSNDEEKETSDPENMA